MIPALPPLNLAASANATARGGEFFGGGSPFSQGDWIVNTGSGENGMSQKTIFMAAAVGAVLWFMCRKKSA